MKKKSSWPGVCINFIQTNLLIVLIVLLASGLRLWQLDNKAIFFGDAGRDLLQAAESVRSGTVPLLGIPSSIPRFHQGPVTIWIEMLIFALVGSALLPYSLVFAGLSLAAVIGLYELTTVYLSRKQAVLAAALLAASPLAVAHGRMVYHTAAIPLATILFLWAMIRFAKQEKYAWFTGSLAWAFLFQFELALLPLVLLIPFIIWHHKLKLSAARVVPLGAGLLVGLLPQIIHDLTHGFAQLGGFAVWVGYRLVSAVSVVGENAVGPDSLARTAEQLWLYGGRVVSTDQPLISILALGLLMISGWVSWKAWRAKSLPLLMELAWVGFGILLLGFTVHSSPSEAYFPVMVIFVPLLLSYALARLKGVCATAAAGAVAIWCGLMVFSIFDHNFFVDTPKPFAYGLSAGTQREVIEAAEQLTPGSYQFKSLNPGASYPSYFDNLRWLLKEKNLQENPQGTVVFVEAKNSPLGAYPNITKVELKTTDLYFYE